MVSVLSADTDIRESDMPFYHYTYEDVGFADDEAVSGNEMTENQAQAYNKSALAEGVFPSGVKGVISGSISSDGEDSDGAGEYKRFVIVTLLIEAADDDGEDFPIPMSVLSNVVAKIAGSYEFCLEGNWEVVGIDPVDGP